MSVILDTKETTAMERGRRDELESIIKIKKMRTGSDQCKEEDFRPYVVYDSCLELFNAEDRTLEERVCGNHRCRISMTMCGQVHLSFSGWACLSRALVRQKRPGKVKKDEGRQEEMLPVLLWAARVGKAVACLMETGIVLAAFVR